MKLKKSLLALTTAATVAVAGTTAAVAEEKPTANSNSSATNGANNGEDPNTDPSKELTDKEKQKKERQEKLANSSNKFFGWTEKTEGLQKFKDVIALVTAVGALVAGIVTLANNFQKLGKLCK